MTEAQRPWWMLHWPSWVALVFAALLLQAVNFLGRERGSTRDGSPVLAHGFPARFLERSQSKEYDEWQFGINNVESASRWAIAGDAKVVSFSSWLLLVNAVFAIVVLVLATRFVELNCRLRVPKPRLSISMIFATVGLIALFLTLPVHLFPDFAPLLSMPVFRIDVIVGTGLTVVLCVAWLGLVEFVFGRLSGKK